MTVNINPQIIYGLLIVLNISSNERDNGHNLFLQALLIVFYIRIWEYLYFYWYALLQGRRSILFDSMFDNYTNNDYKIKTMVTLLMLSYWNLISFLRKTNGLNFKIRFFQ